MGNLLLGVGQAAPQTFDLAEPTLAFGFQDAREEVVADLDEPRPFGRVNDQDADGLLADDRTALFDSEQFLSAGAGGDPEGQQGPVAVRAEPGEDFGLSSGIRHGICWERSAGRGPCAGSGTSSHHRSATWAGPSGVHEPAGTG
ncbi:hypothetical protein ACIQGO_13500 [Streptomyces shenzhenensis]|uniref:hypothetical protein n=1 Tax=Streptomyces shenzhenensis TaxID=943815 RepID=UPI00382C7E29